MERANQTLQDRLVKELRLRNLSCIAANAYLDEFRKDFNRRLAVPACSMQDAHRPLLPSENLDRIFTRQRSTTLSKNLTVQSNKILYQIQTERPPYALHKAPVVICENAQGAVTILYQNQPLAYTTFKKLAHQSEIVETKPLNRAVPLPKLPAANHPWRTYSTHLNGEPSKKIAIPRTHSDDPVPFSPKGTFLFCIDRLNHKIVSAT